MKKFNMILSGFIFVVGCGGSNSSTEFDPIKGTENPPDVEGCKSDQDCKGDRICEDNVCVNPDVVEEDGGAVEDSGIEIVDKDGSSDVDIEGCRSDQDCKGDRICEDNICVNPDVVEEDGGAIEDSGIEDVKNDNEECIPKTCDEFEQEFNGKACGENIPDGCGGIIEDCGGLCKYDIYTDKIEIKCGGNRLSKNDSNIEAIDPVDNICGSACEAVTNVVAGFTCAPGYNPYICPEKISKLDIKANCNYRGNKNRKYEYCCK